MLSRIICVVKYHEVVKTKHIVGVESSDIPVVAIEMLIVVMLSIEQVFRVYVHY